LNVSPSRVAVVEAVAVVFEIIYKASIGFNQYAYDFYNHHTIILKYNSHNI